MKKWKDGPYMFKDEKTTNYRGKEAHLKTIRLLSEKLRENTVREGALREFLLKGVVPEEKKHSPDHESCKYAPKDTKDRMRVTEKRLCRCMYYYNRRMENEKQQRKCAQCQFPARRNNQGDYEILDYEVPMEKVWGKVGGIDLLIREKTGGPVYAVEVKPENSKEALGRMIAEILTYVEISGYKACGYEVKPAICFFKDSVQWKDYQWLKETPEFRSLMETISVFFITHDEIGFAICRMESEK